MKNWCQAYETIADVGAAPGYLSAHLSRHSAKRIWATDRSLAGVLAMEKTLQGTTVEIRQGMGLAPLADISVDAVVIAGMGSDTLIPILQQRTMLTVSPVFAIQPMQGFLAVHRYLLQARAQWIKTALVKERHHFYGTWCVRFPAEKAEEAAPELTPVQQWIAQEFIDDPLFESWLQALFTQSEQRYARMPSGTDKKELASALEIMDRKLRDIRGKK
ncbi:MAG: tRNA (adenine(22)-N(1))-methyltransferase TrmK [Firmicutes bacterium]|nr:tRNA (adenine(22)-N(1))-methyltransferase TrmK [Bacillota bacterium]